MERARGRVRLEVVQVAIQDESYTRLYDLVAPPIHKKVPKSSMEKVERRVVIRKPSCDSSDSDSLDSLVGILSHIQNQNQQHHKDIGIDGDAIPEPGEINRHVSIFCHGIWGK